MKCIAEIIHRWPSSEAKEWTIPFVSSVCFDPTVLAVVAFGAAARTDKFTADVDLLVVYEGRRPVVKQQPMDVDIRWYERSQTEKLIRDGQELLGWVLQFGELLCEKDAYWTSLRKIWVGKMPFPSAVVADARVERAWRLYDELAAMGDEDAADEQYLVALTQQARAALIRSRVYPASRPELPSQLRSIHELGLADQLDAALEHREFANSPA